MSNLILRYLKAVVCAGCKRSALLIAVFLFALSGCASQRGHVMSAPEHPPSGLEPVTDVLGISLFETPDTAITFEFESGRGHLQACPDGAVDSPCSGDIPVGAEGCPEEDDGFFPDGYTWALTSGLCLYDRVTIDEYRAAHELQFQSEIEAERLFLQLEEASVPLPFNKIVSRNIEYFKSGKMKDRFRRWLERSGRYMDPMQEILRDEGLPEDLVYLSLIESGFSPYARSWMRAMGPWQFIKATGRRYGLKVNWWLDERRDPIKSTRSAARYLKDLYKRFGAWDLAMAAYNAGEGRIGRAVRRTNTDDFWKIRVTRHIRRETKNYVPKYIAATMIAKSPESYGFYDLKYHEPLAYDEVVLDKPVDLAVAARLAGVSVQAVKDINPELKRWATPPYVKEYVLRLPEGTGETFKMKSAGLSPDKLFTMLPYRIEKGDTLGSISRRYKVPLRIIRSMNPGIHPRRLRIGSVIRVPSGAANWKGDEQFAGSGDTWRYRVRKGDTLYSIARRYKVSLRRLMRVNPNVSPRRLRPGDLIRIPARSA